jgi:hypothetical protein
MVKKKMVTVVIAPEIHEVVKVYAKKEGRKIEWVVNIALAGWIEKNKGVINGN